MRNVFLVRLQQEWPLSAEDQTKLLAAMTATRRISPRCDIALQGERRRAFQVILEGFACRYKLVGAGQRSITAYLVPGDFSGMQDGYFEAPDYGLASLSACTVADIGRSELEALMEAHPRLARALWGATLVDSSIQRQWLANMGRLSSDRQLAHLFCELRLRLAPVGLADKDGFRLPLTQHELGDALGISTVHVNRTLQHLREQGLIRFQDRMLTIPRLDQLEAYCEFDGAYLHLNDRVGEGPPPRPHRSNALESFDPPSAETQAM